MTVYLSDRKSNDALTMYKNNSRFSSKFMDCSPLQISCNLTGMKPAIGYYSYTKRQLQTYFCQKTCFVRTYSVYLYGLIYIQWTLN